MNPAKTDSKLECFVSCVLSVLSAIACLFILSLLFILLSVLRIIVSNFPFDIVKLFLFVDYNTVISKLRNVY